MYANYNNNNVIYIYIHIFFNYSMSHVCTMPMSIRPTGGFRSIQKLLLLPWMTSMTKFDDECI